MVAGGASWGHSLLWRLWPGERDRSIGGKRLSEWLEILLGITPERRR